MGRLRTRSLIDGRFCHWQGHVRLRRSSTNKNATFWANYSDGINAMHQLKSEAIRMKECFLRGRFCLLTSFMRSLQSSWSAKKQMASK